MDQQLFTRSIPPRPVTFIGADIPRNLDNRLYRQLFDREHRLFQRECNEHHSNLSLLQQPVKALIQHLDSDPRWCARNLSGYDLIVPNHLLLDLRESWRIVCNPLKWDRL